MNVVKTKVGNTEVLIETIRTGKHELFHGMENTNISEGISCEVFNAFESAKEVISGIIQEMSDAVAFDENPPDETKIGFSMSLEAEGNLWMIKGTSNATLNVELTWKK